MMYSLVRISATSASNQIEFIGSNLSDTQVRTEVESKLTQQAVATANARREIDLHYPHYDGSCSFERNTVSVWCCDGAKHHLSYLADEVGKNRELQPNHVANAIITAGRFVTQDYNTTEHTSQNRNQALKESWGSNYCVGDIFFMIPNGHSLPDFTVYGENPISFIINMELQRPSESMINEYGELVAKNKIDSRMYRPLRSGLITLEMIENAPWAFIDYHLRCSWGASEEYMALLRYWGFNT